MTYFKKLWHCQLVTMYIESKRVFDLIITIEGRPCSEKSVIPCPPE